MFLDDANNTNNPEIFDFKTHNVIKYSDNCSILFANSENFRNWHSVTEVKSQISRRVFQVIFWMKGDVKCYQT